MRWVLIPLLCAAGAALLAQPADEIARATDAPKPLSPEESRKCFQLPEGFHIELVAAEPMLVEPTAICFDARGWIYVCELHGYNLDGYHDIVELNRTGVLDRTVRRIPASRQARDKADRETYGTVKLLQTDSQGRVVRSSVFADRLPPCYGVVPARDGVIVLCAPHIIYLADRTGSGKADVRETLFTGFGVGEIWTRINNPRWGPDNWIYAACGASSGGTISGPRLKEPVKLGSAMGFRFQPDGSRLEPVSGGTSGYGLALDDWGDRFLCTNQQHALHVAPLPYAALARNPYSPGSSPVENISSYGHPARVFPISRPDPWRSRRGQQPEWVKFYGANETSAGLFTSACAPCLYQADLFPPAYRNNHFSCEPAQNLVHRCLLEPKGAGFIARRADKDREFLASSDRWFRPINLSVGPDGALYIVDMYREIIEDYSAIPRYLQQQYVESLINGRDRGRIWRIRAGDPEQARWPNLASASPGELVAELGSANVWRRLTAQRLLVERAERKAAPALEELVRHGQTPQARLHALYTLDGLEALTPALVGKALGDEHHGVRVRALELAQRWLDHEPALLARALKLVDDPHLKVRLQLAFSLGQSHDARVLAALARLALSDGADRWMRTAILSSVPTQAGRLAMILLQEHPEQGWNSPLLGALASVAGARNHEEELAELLRFIAELKGARAPAVQKSILGGLAEGLKRARSTRELAPAGQQALERLLASSPADVKPQALLVAGLVKLRDSAGLRAIRASAVQAARDRQRALGERLEAIGLLAGAPAAELAPLQELLDARVPLDLQLAVIRLFSNAQGPDVTAVLLKNWAGHSPQVQAAVIDAICSRQDRLAQLLEAIQQGTVEVSGLPPLRQTQLLENPDTALRDRARKLLAGRVSSDERRKVLEQYRTALTLPRNPRKGKEVYDRQCLKCHQLDGQGFAVGPDLAAVQNRLDESLLVDILDPSSTLTAGFRTYTIITRNGKVYTGVLAAETATSITLRREQGMEDTILRGEIDQMAAAPKSLMPDGLEKEVGPQDLANLIGYLREVLRAGARKVVLFDEESAFVAALGEGEGKAVLTSEDRFTGKACLKVTPPQRFSARITGWNHRIVEKPGGPDEYRYLRFAWKCPEGAGAMLELADNGNWPKETDPRRRYYSGRNTTRWQAREVSKEVPRGWVVVTCDLWKECGSFTLTGLAPTAMGGPVFFDWIELLQALD
jgi:putative membrane-bound dehydrogenase-like protein